MKTMPNEDGLVRRIIVRCKQSNDNGKVKMTELERAANNVVVIIPVKDDDDDLSDADTNQTTNDEEREQQQAEGGDKVDVAIED